MTSLPLLNEMPVWRRKFHIPGAQNVMYGPFLTHSVRGTKDHMADPSSRLSNHRDNALAMARWDDSFLTRSHSGQTGSGISHRPLSPEAIEAQTVTKPGYKLQCLEQFVCGGVAERLKAAVLKTVRPARVSGVRIPPPPPCYRCPPSVMSTSLQQMGPAIRFFRAH